VIDLKRGWRGGAANIFGNPGGKQEARYLSKKTKLEKRRRRIWQVEKRETGSRMVKIVPISAKTKKKKKRISVIKYFRLLDGVGGVERHLIGIFRGA